MIFSGCQLFNIRCKFVFITNRNLQFALSLYRLLQAVVVIFRPVARLNHSYTVLSEGMRFTYLENIIVNSKRAVSRNDFNHSSAKVHLKIAGTMKSLLVYGFINHVSKINRERSITERKNRMFKRSWHYETVLTTVSILFTEPPPNIKFT